MAFSTAIIWEFFSGYLWYAFFPLWFLYFNLNDSYCFLSMNEKELELLSLFFNPEITILWNIMFSLKIPLLHLNICNSQFS